MILGADHVALSCREVVEGARCLESFGYTTQFTELDLPNDAAKKAFLSAYAPSHAIAYCRHEHGMSVELVQHAAPLREGLSAYQVAVEGWPAEAVAYGEAVPPSWSRAWEDVFGCGAAEPAVWGPFRAQMWCVETPGGAPRGSVRGIMLPVSDLAAAKRFWGNGLGGRAAAQGTLASGEAWARLSFPSPVPAWSLEIVLAESAVRPGHPLLDASGFACLALLTNRLEADAGSAMRRGGREAGPRFDLTVSGKLLHIIMVRGPGGELVELIQV